MLITLAILTLITILVLAFLGLASQDLKSTHFYVYSQQADQIARGGLDFVVGNLQGEIEDGNLSTNTGAGSGATPFYVPKSGTYAAPMRMIPLGSATTNLLLVSSSGSFYANGPSCMGSAEPSTNVTLNNQVITASDWNKPMLVPTAQTGTMPIPNWVLVSRNGPVSLPGGTVSSAVNPNLTNSGAVIGRYAFAVYDTSGLLDVNVAGYDSSQPSMATNAAGKGLLPWADLTQLPGMTTGDINKLVQFRNSVSETNFPVALTNSLVSNGFMQVYATNGVSDSTFLSRQELIQFASSSATGSAALSNAVPYFTTFSRELNGPTWGPTTNATGSAYQYQTLAAAADPAGTCINPNIYAVKVPASWVGSGTTRNNGLAWTAGEPLVKYRFPLDKLALLEKMQGTPVGSSTLTSADINNIAKYFGLDPVADSNGLYRHWQYPTANPNYQHTIGQILTLGQVAALTTPREPDFFELLQAGILHGSLGVYGRGDVPPLTPVASAPLFASYPNWEPNSDPDAKTTLQIMRIGANIIDQWDADSYPTKMTFNVGSGISYDVYGIEDLPYITQMFTKISSPNGNRTLPANPYVYFQVWNPHQKPLNFNAAEYPSKFRIAPYSSGASAADQYQFNIVTENPVYRWPYNPGSGPQQKGYGGTSTNAFFYTIPATSGGGAETASTAGVNFAAFNLQNDYREPGLVIGTPNPIGWTPTGIAGGSPPGSLAAISLPPITNLPPVNTYSSSAGSGTNVLWNPTGAPPFPSSVATIEQNWYVKFGTVTTLVLQFQDSVGNWQTYSTFEGLDTPSPPSPYTGVSQGGFVTPAPNTSINDISYAKSDPRTFRFGPGNVAANYYQNANNGPLLSPTSLSYQISTLMPFETYGGAGPYRMDNWVANNPNNPVVGASFAANNGPYYPDLDGVYRGGDSAYAYSGTGTSWGSDPVLPGGSGSSYQNGALPGRPVMLNHPFNSVGDLGYVYRDDPWRTLDFMTPGSADAGLLDLFSLSEAPIVAGRINPNTPYKEIVQSLLNGATQSSLGSLGATPALTSTTAQSVAQSFVSATSANPITNRASLVTSGLISNMVANPSGGFPTKVKTEAESVVRSIAESSNTRTWNFLIDVIGQSGHFVNNTSPLTSVGKDNFVVEGERRYWLHVAIDRFTGQVVDEQLEIVDQ